MRRVLVVLAAIAVVGGVAVSKLDASEPGLMDGWYSYDYREGLDVDPAVNVFHAAVATDGAVWANHRQWSIDDPESPKSVLALVRYDVWDLSSGEVVAEPSPGRTVDCVRFEIRGDLDLHGGAVDFWLMSSTFGERWHSPPLEVGDGWTEHTVRVTSEWRNSWRRDRTDPAQLDATSATANSMGIGFVGFDGEPTGKVGLRDLSEC